MDSCLEGKMRHGWFTFTMRVLRTPVRRMALFLVVLCACGWISCQGAGGTGAGGVPTYAVSGTVTGTVASGVTLTLSGAGSATTTSSSGGTYAFSGLPAGTYTITPALSGYRFSPTSATVTISSANVTGTDFTSTAIPATYSLSGTVSGAATGGVTLTLAGASSATTTTSSSGAYTFSGLSAGTYMVTPALSGYSFSPVSATVTISSANVTGTDFTSTAIAGAYSLSGTVSGAIGSGVTLTLSGAGSATTTSDATGAYAFSVTAGTYTVTPSRSGYTFSPSSATRTVSANTTGVDFTSAASSSSTVGDRTNYGSITLASGGTYSSSSSGVSRTGYEYTSTTSDTPAIKVAPGGSLTLTSCKATKSGGATSSTENSGFYGFNSGVLASSSSSTSSYVETHSATTATLTDCTINTSVAGANGAFAFGQGATVTLDHVTIATTGSSNSRGVDATYGGTVNITDSLISTQGGSCAALATDRYNGATAPKINATRVTGTTAGTGSPGIYCTGTFTVSDCTLTATGSEAAVIEGLNSITATNTSLTGAAKWGVMIYQSMSGDASTGTGTFTMTGGSITNTYASGPAFFVCNTDAVITLNGVAITNASSMLLVAGKASTAASHIGNVNSSWGTNGGVVTLAASNQSLSGSVIICDSSSSIAMTLVHSTFMGAIDSQNLGGANSLTLDANSTWTLAGNSYLKSLTNHGTINKGGYQLYVNGVAQ